MGFFNLVQNTVDPAPDPAMINAEATGQPENRESNRPTCRETNTGTTKPRPEPLKFLKPCPICRGRNFIHGKKGGFFCATCQPGIEGIPVRAMGSNHPAETAQGLPCPGCGSREYNRVKDGYLFPDGSCSDGWHCGGKTCGVKLLIGNKKEDRKTKEKPLSAGDEQKRKPSANAELYFRAAFPWLMRHLPALLAAGWTRPELFRRGKYAWPVGEWGLAWLPVWLKNGLKIKISATGQLIFTFQSCGRTIAQSASQARVCKK